MKAIPGPIGALYAAVTLPPAPAVPLSERRRDSTGFPSVPVAGRELPPGEVAAALFEAEADSMAVPVPDTSALHAVLTTSVHALSVAQLAKNTEEFAHLDAGEFPEVGVCRTFAYRLALAAWYERARSRPMTAGEAAVALYLSDAYRHHTGDAFRRAPLLVSRAIRQGAARIPLETLVRLGAVMAGEFAPAVTRRVTQVRAIAEPATPGTVTGVTAGRDWLYGQALPDAGRRRFCFTLLRADALQPSPLIVRPDGAALTLGATPPPGFDGGWYRPLKARW
ncbi:hypothetical protein [Streptomyces adonidis]|uniref:hypothetical protein n=1 Tax=Streptomyces adonidis TaxID=3231367 RepID=UPI0034DADC33